MSDLGLKITSIDNQSFPTEANDPVCSVSTDSKLDILMAMFTKFQDDTRLERSKNHHDMEELRLDVSAMRATSSPHSYQETPFPDRKKDNRRTSMFLSSPSSNDSDLQAKPQITIIQSPVVYDVELKVSSLAGLRYLFKQQQRLATKYPHHDILLSHMVSFNLRQHVLASYNSHRYRESIIRGEEPEELMCEKWLTFNNKLVLDILVEVCRPRTREQCAKDFIMFLGLQIPQKFRVNADNFSKDFYEPMMQSLWDLEHLSALISEESSNYSRNKAKVPLEGFGTKDNPGLIQVWVLSLGVQKDAFLQLLGRDELTRFKTLEPAIKFIRYKLMEVRNQSEIKLDLDSKLTPIRYDDLHQGESHTRQQTEFVPRQPFAPTNRFRSEESHKSRYQPTKSSLAALHAYPDETYTEETEPANDLYHYQDTEEQDEDLTVDYEDSLENPPVHSSPDYQDSTDPFLAAIGDVRSAVASTYRGYCSELFVFGACSKLQSGCTFDHSSAGLERCITSFTLLGKRELLQHSALPPLPPRSTSISTSNPSNHSRSYATPNLNRSSGSQSNSNRSYVPQAPQRIQGSQNTVRPYAK